MAKKELRGIKDMREALKREEGKGYTLEQLQLAKEIYTEIANEGYKTKEWTKTNIALNVLQKAHKEFLIQDEAKDYNRTLFMQDNGSGYNAVLSKLDPIDNTHINVLSVKYKKDLQAEELCDDFNFYLRG